MKVYERVVISEGGFVIKLTNNGKKIKENPNPLNPKGEEIKCLIKGCRNTTKSIYGVCNSCRNKGRRILHLKDWVGTLIYPDGRVEEAPPHYKITEWLITWAREENSERRFDKLDEFFQELLESVVGRIPDATTLQRRLDGEVTNSDIPSPDDIVEMVRRLVDKHFSNEDSMARGTPVKIAAALVAIAYICEEANRGDFWFYSYYKPVYGRPKRGSAYMPFVYYLLRRYTKAKPEQARMCLKG